MRFDFSIALSEDGSNNVYITGSQFNIPQYATYTCTAPTSASYFPLCSSAATGTATPYVSGFAGDASGGSDLGADGFIAQFSSAGALGWSTMLGSTSDDFLTGIAVDQTNSFVYVVGSTYGVPPVTGATGTYTDNTAGGGSGGYTYSDCFFAKFSTVDFSLKWLTLFGGAEQDEARDVAVDATGTAYVVGITQSSSATSFSACNSAASSTSFPMCAVSHEYSQTTFASSGPSPTACFIAQFNTSNVLAWSTYISGNNSETYEPTPFYWTGSPAVSIDGSTGDVYMYGSSYSSSAGYIQNSSSFDYNQASNSQSSGTSNAFVLDFSGGSLHPLNWGSFYGGVGSKAIANPSGSGSYSVGDMGMDVVGYGGNIFITGLSYSNNNFPITIPPTGAGAYNENHSTGSNSDAFVAEINGTSGITGIQNQSSSNLFKVNEYLIYPNPNNGQFTIKGALPQNTQLQVVNTLGQVVYSSRQENSIDETQLDLSGLPNGVYLLNIIKSSLTTSQKICIFK